MRFKNLKYVSALPHLQLSLAENRIKSLPNDLSMLRGIESINLNNNLIKDVMGTAVALKSLPRLKALNINLNSEEEVDFLIRTLPNLEFLNGLSRSLLLTQTWTVTSSTTPASNRSLLNTTTPHPPPTTRPLPFPRTPPQPMNGPLQAQAQAPTKPT